MPTIITRGAASALGFGFGGDGRQPPGTYTYPIGFTGANNYFPVGWLTVNLILTGSSGGVFRGVASSGGAGSRTTRNAISPTGLNIYSPSSLQVSTWSGGGNGGTGGTVSVVFYSGGYGGAVCVGTWTTSSSGGGTMVSAGGGGGCGTSGARRGGIEGTTYGSLYSGPSGTNGGTGENGGCYYGGGGGGGGYSTGGGGGLDRNGGAAGGNGSMGGGSFNYNSIVVGAYNSGVGYAQISWG